MLLYFCLFLLTDATPKLTATLSQTQFVPGFSYDDSVQIKVEGENVDFSKYTLIAAVEHGTVDLVSDKKTAKKFEQKLDDEGKLTFSLKIGEVVQDTVFLLSFTLKEGTKEKAQKKIGGSIGSAHQKGFNSDRVASEIFVGSSFARGYDQDGTSTGFDESSLLGVFRVDSLWGRGKNHDIHTGLNLSFSSFPTTEQKSPNDPKLTEFADAFSGSLTFLWQPSRLGFNSPTSRNSDPNLKYDAIRFGLMIKASVISREIKEENGDTDIASYRIGFSFTHTQTNAPDRESDNINRLPIRFVEVSYARYETIFDQEDADRFVLEAGVRIPGISSDTLPFYAGIYYNAGEGQDDLRVFGGFLFSLDRMTRFF